MWWAVLGGGTGARALVTAAALGLVVLFGSVTYRVPALHHVLMGVGALAWAAGAGTWWLESLVDWRAATKVPWWTCFLVVTIAGERLELARVLQLEQWQRVVLSVGLGAFFVGAATSMFAPDLGIRVFALGTLATAGWLIWFDVARRTALREGLTAYIGRVLLSGYAWLGIGGVLLLIVGGVSAGPAYGAAWHAVLLGFVFMMIFAHAPVVIRALARRRVCYHPVLYVPPLAMTATLAVRIAADFGGMPGLRIAGGAGNAVAIALFGLIVAVRLR